MTLKLEAIFKKLSLNTWALICIFLVTCAMMLPMAQMGIPDGFDLLQHVRFADAYHDAISSGDLVPAWAANDNFGFGSIGIRYYPPLAYILLALTKMLVGTWYDSFWINSFFWMFLGCAGVYFWAREWLNEPRAFFASLLYAIAPYHTFQIYQAVLFAEFAASAIIPFCFLFLTRLCRTRSRLDTLLFSISLSLLILTHIPSTIIGCIGMGVYAILIIDRSKIFSTSRHLITAFIASLASTAFHWMKLVTEMNWVMHNSPQYSSSGFYDYQRYFFPIYLISPSQRYVEKEFWQLDTMIAITILFAIPSIIFLGVKKWRKDDGSLAWRQHLPVFLTGVFSIFMLSIASSLVWKYVPILPKLQFPWRWLLVATAVAPVSFVIALSKLMPGRRILSRGSVYLNISFVLCLAFFAITQNIIPSLPLERRVFEGKVSGMNDVEACPCWWPIWANSAAFIAAEKVTAGSRGVTVASWKSETRSFVVEAGEVNEARIATFYHPYWKAAVNGVETAVSKDDSGVLLVSIPAESAEVWLTFREPFPIRAAKVVSLVSWLIIVFGVAMMIKIRRRGLL
ncbi:MAG: 6-pyruvoyl-tetrahydropterin synthase-related protein [Pyrinomonadaceae bacterium]